MASSGDEHAQGNLEESLSETDRSASDIDQTLSESDQESSDRDETASQRDQRASDIDQDASDHPGEEESRARYERTHRMRAESVEQRGATTEAREHTVLTRERVARQRDLISAARDLASAARDELAAALDAEIERLEAERLEDGTAQDDGRYLRLRLAHARRVAARARAGAAAQREAAAEDRAHAARDREMAVLDRLAYGKELANAEIDEVTGALRRGVGLAAMQREMDRTARAREQLTIVFVDVDGLKRVNDEEGHSAGDALLRAVVESVTAEFRSYDLIIRFGGDEFVCVLCGDGLEGVEARFKRIASRIDIAFPGATISIGIGERRAEDTVQTLIDRADGAMIEQRRNCRLARHSPASMEARPADLARPANGASANGGGPQERSRR